mmetsp:Transcript_19826/g.55133  ORF Transcript_19826/g.55133 Transcript_19826/m.55133 type:complete len:113 (+) Transcript_19826:712-1050(+)
MCCGKASIDQPEQEGDSHAQGGGCGRDGYWGLLCSIPTSGLQIQRHAATAIIFQLQSNMLAHVELLAWACRWTVRVSCHRAQNPQQNQQRKWCQRLPGSLSRRAMRALSQAA